MEWSFFRRGLDRTYFISFSLALYYLGKLAHDVNFWRRYPLLSWLWSDSGIIGFYIRTFAPRYQAPAW